MERAFRTGAASGTGSAWSLSPSAWCWPSFECATRAPAGSTPAA